MPNLTRSPCPSCGDFMGASLLLGMPGTEVREAVEYGEVVLGGCDFISDKDGNLPNMECLRCDHQWFDPEAKHYEEEEAEKNG